ncbi:MAG: efflux RND transporter permease subunit [Bacteroidota bacterium]
MRRLQSFLLSQRWIVLLLTAMVVVVGGLAWQKLPIDAFPDVTNVQVMVLTEAPGLSPADVESQVTFPLEQQMGGLPHVTQVRSMSKSGLSQVVVVFEDGTDIYFARQQVFERLQLAQLPPEIEPELAPISTGLGEIFQYTLESDTHTPTELRTLQDWLVAPQLRPLAGVTEVNSFGGFVKQYQVLDEPDKLLQYGITLREVVEAVERNNANAGGGFIVRGWEQTYIRGLGLLRGIGDLEKIVLKAKDGTPVTLGDVARIQPGAEPRQGSVTRDGKGEAVAGMVIMLRDANSKDVVSRVKQAIPAIQSSLPKGVRLHPFYDRTSLIEACIETVMRALMEGGIFVILVLFLFLAELRTALTVLLSLPLTFLITFIFMGWQGLSSNLMSLGGLAFSVGMVVDASIVVVENVRRHLARSEENDKKKIVAEAVAEVASPIAFSILIIVLVMVPLFTLQGVEGKMFKPLAWTMIIAILSSLFVALVPMPVVAEWVLKQTPEKEFGFVRRFHRGYLNLLERFIRHPKTLVGISLSVLVFAGLLVPRLGSEFMPLLDEGALAINVVRLPNASLEGSTEVARFMEQRLKDPEKFPEIETVVSKTGRAEISEDPMGPEQTDVLITLKKGYQKVRSRTALIAAIQGDLGQIPGLRLSFSQPISLRVNELISGVKSDLAVKIFGPDLALLKERADEAAAILGEVKGAQDVRIEQISGLNQIEVEIDREAIARYQINVADVNEIIETAIGGKKATTLIEDQMRFATVVRFPEESRRDVREIEKILVPGGNGHPVPLGQLAKIREVEAPAQISREMGMRRVVVETNIRGRDLGGFVQEAEGKLKALEKKLPPGYFLRYGGQFENQERAMRQLAIVVPIALLLILVLLFMALGSKLDAGLVLLNLPFALVGGILAIGGFRMPLSVSAAIAFIILLGIAVQNGVVLVAFIRQERNLGASLEAAVRTACDLRFRPLLMTALTSFIGHLPMLYATGSGADIQRPLAVVVMGGLITSTLLTLLVLPVLYLGVHRLRGTLAPRPYEKIEG